MMNKKKVFGRLVRATGKTATIFTGGHAGQLRDHKRINGFFILTFGVSFLPPQFERILPTA